VAVGDAEAQTGAPATPIPWYPDELGWTMRASRQDVRRSPTLEAFRKHLVLQTELVRPHAPYATATATTSHRQQGIHRGRQTMWMCRYHTDECGRGVRDGRRGTLAGRRR
jgi:hypothetical protein